MKAGQVTSGNTGSAPFKGGANRKLVTFKLAALDELHQVILEKNMKNMKRVAKTVGTLGLRGMRCHEQPIRSGGRFRLVRRGQRRPVESENRRREDHQQSARAQVLPRPRSAMTTATTGYKLFGGYKFNKNFALEGGYFDLGKFGFTATTVPAGTLNGNIKLKGLNLDAVGILPIAEKFSAFGRVGLNYAQAKDSFTGTGAVSRADESEPQQERYELQVRPGCFSTISPNLSECASRRNATGSTMPSATKATSTCIRSA